MYSRDETDENSILTQAIVNALCHEIGESKFMINNKRKPCRRNGDLKSIHKVSSDNYYCWNHGNTVVVALVS